MFADDLLIIAEGWKEAEAALDAMEEWAAACNMAVNKAKSGVMALNGPAPTTEALAARGYPLVERYKYLGCLVTPRLRLSDHTKAIEGKHIYLRGQLGPVLRGGKARFNVSLFRTLAFPLYRLAFPLYDLAE